ncbi:MAG: anaerobic ribonucleoside-triphosphate reductase activating protein [Candidatus Korarchaeota archaeon]
MSSGFEKSASLLIDSIVPISLNDVIGEVSFVIFSCGCNFRCPYCQNWPIIEQANRICSVKHVDVIIKEIEGFKKFISYVQASGGEPTLQADSIKILFQRVRSENLKTSLNTNGSNPIAINDLIRSQLLDHLAMDIKTSLNPEKYAKAIGLPIEISKAYIERIVKTLEIASKMDFIEVRTTYVPGLVCESDLIEVADTLASYLSKKRHFYVIQQYVPNQNAPDPKFRKGNILDHSKLQEIALKVREKLPNVVLRHMGGVEYL